MDTKLSRFTGRVQCKIGYEDDWFVQNWFTLQSTCIFGVVSRITVSNLYLYCLNGRYFPITHWLIFTQMNANLKCQETWQRCSSVILLKCSCLRDEFLTRTSQALVGLSSRMGDAWIKWKGSGAIFLAIPKEKKNVKWFRRGSLWSGIGWRIL